MGRTILTIAGAAVGAYVTGGNPYGIWAGSMVGAFLGGLIFPEDAMESYGPRLSELQVQSSAYGNPIVKIYGAARSAGNVIWADEVVEHSQTEEQGGKGDSPSQKTTTYWYTCSFAIGICEGPENYLLKIWADGNVIYDNTGPEIVQASGIAFTFYPGNETQLPDPLIESIQGSGEVPAHRGLCYIVFTNFPISDYGNRIPNFNFLVTNSITGDYDKTAITSFTPSIWNDLILDATGTFLYVHKYNGWYGKINVLDNSIVIPWTQLPNSWGFLVGGNDIDEQGNVYGMLENHPDHNGDWGVPCRYNSNFGLAAYASEDIYLATGCRVSWNPYYPYVVYSSPLAGDYLNVFYRDSMTPVFFDSDGRSIPFRVSSFGITGFGYNSFHGVCFDDKGNFYVLCARSGGTATDTYLIKMSMDDWSYEVWDIESLIVAATYIMYEPTTGHLWISNSNETIIWDTLSETYVKNLDKAGAGGRQWRRVEQINHTIVGSGDTICEWSLINTVQEAVVREIAECEAWGYYTHEHLLFEPLTNSIYSYYYLNYLEDLKLEKQTPDAVTLASIVKDICEEVGLVDTTDFNVTELESTDVRGYIISSRMPARRAIEPLQAAFFFDGVETSGVLKFVMRGGESVVTIDDDDMRAHGESEDTPDPIVTQRIQELELPYEVTVEYMDVDMDYEVGSQRGRRLITQSKELKSMSLAIAFNKDEARQIAEKTIQMVWKERDRYRFQLGRKYWYLDPTDVVTLTVGSATYVTRFTKAGLGLSGVMNVDAVKEDSAVYTNDSTGAGNEADRPPGISWEGPTEYALIDVPALRDSEASNSPSGFYIAATGYLSAWRGANLYKSIDYGFSWAGIMSILNEAVIGTVVTPLPSIPDPNTWDRSSRPIVRLLTPGATLSSVTEDQVLNNYNGAIIGEEVIQFANATLNADGTYTLDTLLRGRRGSEYAVDNHNSGELFVLLNLNNIYRYEMDSSEVDIERLYRGVSIGMSMSSGMDKTFTNTARSGHPLSVVHIKGDRDGSDNLTITWVRRTRINGSWRDLVEVDLGETTEAYEIDVYNNGTVVRTIEAIDETASYTAAQQTSDGLTPGDPVHVKIYQMSETFGRGFESEATI